MSSNPIGRSNPGNDLEASSSGASESCATLAFPGNGRQNEADAEIQRLKRELSIARQERDILKKAAAYFANAKN